MSPISFCSSRALPALILCLGFVGCASREASKPPADLGRLLPPSAGAWTADASDQTYDRETIFQYIDGAGEVYLQYDFRRVLVRGYSRPGSPKITAQVFEMGNSSDAYGIFTLEREEADAGIGEDSEYASGLLRFWKGTMLVCVSGERETPEVREAILAIGRASAAKIVDRGTRPEMIEMLPPEVAPRTSIRFFHGPLGLATHFPLGDGNPLNLSLKTDVVLATCRFDDQPSRLLIVRYPDAATAGAAWGSYRSNSSPTLDADGFAKSASGRWNYARIQDRTIIAIFDAPDQSRARSCVDQATRQK